MRLYRDFFYPALTTTPEVIITWRFASAIQVCRNVRHRIGLRKLELLQLCSALFAQTFVRLPSARQRNSIKLVSLLTSNIVGRITSRRRRRRSSDSASRVAVTCVADFGPIRQKTIVGVLTAAVYILPKTSMIGSTVS
jgi:hypothetical protein